MRYLFLAASLLIITACGTGQYETEPTPDSITRPFLANYEPYCGETFTGKSVYTDLGEDSPLNDADLTMIITHCSEDEVRIRFFVEEDTSRTWILGYLEDGLRLAHDHRNADGSEYEANFYGGVAMNNTNGIFRYYPENSQPSESVLYFPADARTLADRAAREINVWSKAFDTANELYYYRLYLSGELRFEAEFDLTEPVTE